LSQMTDAELVTRLQLIREHGSISKAAAFLGIARSALGQSGIDARRKGLTADTVVQDELGKSKTKIRLLETQIKNLRRENDTAEKIREQIFELAQRPPEPPAWLASTGKPGSRGAPTMVWSDWHYGEEINSDEVGGVNQYNSAIARTRATKLVNTTIDLAYNHMGRAKQEYPGAIICLGGDMMGGDIHEELAKTNDRTPEQCVNDLTDILAGCLDTMASKFGKLFVPCVVGNHGRSTKKLQMKQRVFTSYEWIMYCNLERYFKRSKHVQFHIPSETDAFFNVFGHRYILTHGDSLGVKGGDGIIGALGPIMRGTMKVHRSEAQIGRDFDTAVICHWHQYLTLPGLIVNNSFKGYDEYARLVLRAPYSRPSQALWFTHPEHGITAHWQVYLEALKTSNDNAKWVEFQQVLPPGLRRA
jgi:hypothetical protein